MKELKDKIELKLMPVDFEGTVYSRVCNCGISKAVVRQLGAHTAEERVDIIHIKSYLGMWHSFNHANYTAGKFYRDRKKAASSNFRGKEPIRTIVLNRVK